MLVVGIDPASGKKGSYVFAPEAGLDRANQSAAELKATLRSIRETHRDVLVCWDAPLTGPPQPDASDPGNLIERGIETRYAKLTRNVEGVKVRGYAQLSHWVITRHVLGLPRVGGFDAELRALPFMPVFSPEPPSGGAHVAEVHPTLAAWAWLGESFEAYKGSGSAEAHRGAIRNNWEALRSRSVLASVNARFGSQLDLPNTMSGLDDALDARVAWLLGTLWVEGAGVTLEGSETEGSFLMPTT
ncbi:MAG: DUF429 domain-containing protein [Sandaracinaceae bacterium]